MIRDMNEAFRYEALAREIERKIQEGVYRVGERLPSVRELHRQLQLSVTTILRAYEALENYGMIEVRPKSGYYVKPLMLGSAPRPALEAPASSATPIELNNLIAAVIRAIVDPSFVTLGAAILAPELLPAKAFTRLLKNLSSAEVQRLINYGAPEGLLELRRQIALHHLGVMPHVTPQQIIITHGCMEALALSLQTLTCPGDTIALESPTYYAILQLVELLGLRVVELPTDPQTGVQVEALEQLLQKTSVKVCLFMPTVQNPLGSTMPEAQKAALMAVLNRYDVPVIEDLIYADLFYAEQRPCSLRAYDQKDSVMTCSSFSKVLAPGLRVGWVIPPQRFQEALVRLKIETSVCNSPLNQEILAQFLTSGAYARHLRTLKQKLKRQTSQVADALRRYFPPETRFVMPQGGFLLWVELPEGVDCLALYERARQAKISILPGILCSTTSRLTRYIRLSCGAPFTETTEHALALLGKIVWEMQTK